MESLTNNKQSVLEVDTQKTFHKAVIKTYYDLEKYRRFKIGCEASDCTISDMNYLFDMICKPCLTKEQTKIIKEKIQSYE